MIAMIPETTEAKVPEENINTSCNTVQLFCTLFWIEMQSSLPEDVRTMNYLFYFKLNRICVYKVQSQPVVE